MNGNHLPLKMSRQLADCDADVSERSLDLVAIGFALVGAVEIEESLVPGRNLDGLVTVGFRPSRNAGERVVRWRIACELSKKQARALDGPHRAPSLNGLSFHRSPRRGNIPPCVDTCENPPIVNSAGAAQEPQLFDDLSHRQPRKLHKPLSPNLLAKGRF